MNCEMCEQGDWEVILPVPNIERASLVCATCAEKSEAYCKKHQRPHLGFEDGTTVCIECVEETVLQDGEKIAGSFATTVSQSVKATEIGEAIDNWFDGIKQALAHIEIGELPMAFDFLEASRAQNIARLIITVSQRQKISPQEVIEKVAKEGPRVIFGDLLDLLDED